MPYEEAQRYQQGSGSASFYSDALEHAKREQARRASLPDVIRADEMPWEDSPQGYPQEPPYQWWRRHDEYPRG